MFLICSYARPKLHGINNKPDPFLGRKTVNAAYVKDIYRGAWRFPRRNRSVVVQTRPNGRLSTRIAAYQCHIIIPRHVGPLVRQIIRDITQTSRQLYLRATNCTLRSVTTHPPTNPSEKLSVQTPKRAHCSTSARPRKRTQQERRACKGYPPRDGREWSTNV